MLFQKGPCLQVKDGSCDVGGDEDNMNQEKDDIAHRFNIREKEGTIDQIRDV